MSSDSSAGRATSPGRVHPFGRLAAAALTIGAVVLSSGIGRAHEEYVTDEREDVELAAFYREALSDPAVVGPLLVAGVALALAIGAYLYGRPVRRDLLAFRVAMSEYREYVPWLLRISFGIPLIGAGFSGYFVSPAVAADVRLLQVLLGFLLLFGLTTRLAAIAALVVYVVGLAFAPALLLQFEVVGGALAIAILGGGTPSADHVLLRLAETEGTITGRFDTVARFGHAIQARVAPLRRYVPTVCRIGLGLTFVYLGASQKLLDPGLALAVVSRYDLSGVLPVPPELWVLGAGLTEILLGLGLLVGAFTRAVSVTALVVFTATLFALPDDPVLAHVGLFGLASVLLITGAGPWSVDARLSRHDPTVHVPSPGDPVPTTDD
ncbi:DoxX family membrane protein [Halovivax limisalsi]|uniref:DoxX family membrane protein n=1 Tax=Halovivax limisalsi TaxID=1453760 RepID=UPI001FFDA213|nr:DoxX family membrane protein [Halovivax limisalsi]